MLRIQMDQEMPQIGPSRHQSSQVTLQPVLQHQLKL